MEDPDVCGCMIGMNGHNLKRIQISRELRKTEVDGVYVPTRHVNLVKQKMTTDDGAWCEVIMHFFSVCCYN